MNEKIPRKRNHLQGATATAIGIAAVVCVALYGHRMLPRGNAAGAMRNSSANTFKEEEAGGYSVTVPSDWYIEKNASGSIAAYSRGEAGRCKVSVAVFPPVSANARAAWITVSIAADPTVSVKEKLREAEKIAAQDAVRWTGTMDGMSQTLVYIFTPSHAYEVAPSPMEDGKEPDICKGALEAFLKGITFIAS